MASRDIAGSTHAPAEVRHWAADLLRRWDLPREVDRALLVLNELVTNAVVHSPGSARCRLSVDGGALELVVTDAGSGPSRRALRAATSSDVDPLAWERSGGRGLQIVATVADAWGASFEDGRAGVWARWGLAEPWRHADACRCGPDAAPPDAVRLASGGSAVPLPGPWDDPADRGASWFTPGRGFAAAGEAADQA